MALTGNKGEWSEIYVLIKLLSDTKLHSGDENLERIPNLIYPIVKILREETEGRYEYKVDDQITIIHNKQEIIKISLNEFKKNAELLLEKIKSAKSSFEIPEIENFLSKLRCNSVKAPSSEKTDIRIVIHDLKTNQEPELGFSIKSQLGSASTLLNASKATNFIYKITGALSEDEIREINSINTRGKIKERLAKLDNLGCSLEFVDLERRVFRNNLILIDSLLHKILAEMVLLYYKTSYSTIKDIVQATKERNSLNFDFDNDHIFYEYKIKKFLVEIALGMMPATVWTGEYDATGGYLLIKEDGDILAYHLYNRNQFENYLFANTKFETASSSKHRFGKIYTRVNEKFINLNLQIRFKK